MSDAITRLRAALEAGPTPGPWELEEYGDGWLVNDSTGYIITDYSLIGRYDNPRCAQDATYIAAADPTTMAALLDRLDRAEAVVEAVQRVAGYLTGFPTPPSSAAELQRGMDALRAALAAYEEGRP